MAEEPQRKTKEGQSTNDNQKGENKIIMENNKQRTSKGTMTNDNIWQKKQKKKEQHRRQTNNFDLRGISPSSPARSWLLSLIFHIASKQLLFQLLRLVKMADK